MYLFNVKFYNKQRNFIRITSLSLTTTTIYTNNTKGPHLHGYLTTICKKINRYTYNADFFIFRLSICSAFRPATFKIKYIKFNKYKNIRFNINLPVTILNTTNSVFSFQLKLCGVE